jgi:hypothetical protein
LKFSELAKYKTGTELLVSARYEAWMAENANPVYSEEALQFVRDQLSAVPRVRKGTISASSLGSCRRRQQFTFLGMPQLPPSPKTAAIFQNGTMMHIRWQMAGITEGWLTAPEVPVPQNQYRLSGTMDGVLYEGSIVEFKSINTDGFRNVMSFGLKHEHLIQGATYALCTGREKVSFIYEDKNTQEFKEIVKTVEELPMAEASMSAQITWDEIDHNTLAEPLDECLAGEGWRYTSCPYRKTCLKIRDWKEAKDVAHQAA